MSRSIARFTDAAAPADWTQTTLSQSLYKYEALRAAGGAAERAMRKSLDEIWSAMLVWC